jgi:pimeloyl-ACP methyl ester carboxylesterase
MVYLIPGLGADYRAFAKLQLSKPHKVVEWIPPIKGESIQSYAARLLKTIPIEADMEFIGLSFGGIIAIEMSHQLNVPRCCIISSAKSPKDFPFSFWLAKWLRLYALPASWVQWLNTISASHYFSIETEEGKKVLKEIIKDNDLVFQSWAMKSLLFWKPSPYKGQLHHLHGTKDRIFPYKHSNDTIPLRGGHFTIYEHAAEASQQLRKLGY